MIFLHSFTAPICSYCLGIIYHATLQWLANTAVISSRMFAPPQRKMYLCGKSTNTLKKLLSLPPNVVAQFHSVSGRSAEEYFCTSDPVNQKLGSGGGTTWLLEAAHEAEATPTTDFSTWLAREKRILLHAGGQSRRLPAYASCGKVMLPIPVFRWARGQRIDQTLLDLQLPLYERIMEAAPDSLHTLVASGDVYTRATQPLQDIPEADVVCYGLWVEPTQATHHGVFMMPQTNPTHLDFMLQKPSLEQLNALSATHFALMDIGIWLLSDRAVELLRKRSVDAQGQRVNYDLYGQMGCALGLHPSQADEELAQLSVAILPLPGGEFYHFGTTPELIASTTALQNVVKDQRLILQREIKRHPSIFTQNARVEYHFDKLQENIWVENAHLPTSWQLERNHVITGVPENDWSLHLEAGQCVDLVAVGEREWAIRPYGFEDAFRGAIGEETTHYFGRPMPEWLAAHGLTAQDLGGAEIDLQAAQLFPVCEDFALVAELFTWMLAEHPTQDLAETFLTLPRLSADDIAARADLSRQEKQRCAFRQDNLALLALHHDHSVFYQVDLGDMAQKFAQCKLTLPPALPEDTPVMAQIRDAMFRSRYLDLCEQDGSAQEQRAFHLLSEGLTAAALQHRQLPQLAVHHDQIVWARSAVRIDIAGGWTDTPPFCLNSGGNVVNLAVELNGQPPLQVYVKPCSEFKIVCRSIDLGAMEIVTTYEELSAFNKVGSPFSIPKAALALCGFLPQFAQERHATLREALAAFGSGIEITLLAAIPAGSGLGTSSILAATVLGALSDFCHLGWDKTTVCNRTLILEQLLTTGGGWQDQFGGVLHGVKLLQTQSGFDQTPIVRWLPDTLFTASEHRACHLLYYTGLTRTAKHILTEIVRGMFLNSADHLLILNEMKQHALDMFDVIQQGNLADYGALVAKTWNLNKRLDAGTEPPAVAALCQQVTDLCSGYKLPGAGGGGYLYMVAKDPDAAIRIKQLLTEHPSAPSARFVDMTLSNQGLQISRS